MSGYPNSIPDPDLSSEWDVTHHQASHLLLPTRFLEGRLNDQGTLIKKLQTWRAILNLALESVSLFAKGSLDPFDALAGENRCEIRALLTLDLFKQPSISEKLASDLQALLHAKELATSMLQEDVDQTRCESFAEFLLDRRLDLEVSHACVYLVMCRALTITKIKGADQIDRTEPNLLLNHCPALSNKQCKRFTYHWQKLLSQFSMVQLADWGTRLIKSGDPLWMGTLEREWVLVDDKGRSAYPALLGAQIVLESLKQFLQCPLILRINVMQGDTHVQTVHLIYQVSDDLKIFRYVGKGEETVRELGEKSPAFVVEGCSPPTSVIVHPLFESHVQNVDLERMIFTGFAHKSHYPGQNKGRAPDDVQEILSPIRAEFRRNKGCSVNNPSLFCITHISTVCVGELFKSRPVHGIPSGLSPMQIASNAG